MLFIVCNNNNKLKIILPAENKKYFESNNEIRLYVFICFITFIIDINAKQ